MVNKIIVLCFLASTFLVVVQCKEEAITSQDKTNESEVKSAVIEEKKKNLVGGWKAIDVTSTIEKLATYVLTENNVESPIKELSNVSSQVVSGKNYRFQILLENGEKWEAQVYVNIQKERSITTFKQVKS
jgi:hypothetical protein